MNFIDKESALADSLWKFFGVREMSEGSNNSSAFLGVAIANNAAYRGAQREADAARDASSRIGEAAVGVVIALNKARDRIADLEHDLAVQVAHAKGLTAQNDAFRSEAPRSPLLADTGLRFKSGNIKTKVRLIYEAAYDASLIASGIPNPASLRAP